MEKTKPKVRIYTTRLPDEFAVMVDDYAVINDMSHSRVIATIVEIYFKEVRALTKEQS